MERKKKLSVDKKKKIEFFRPIFPEWLLLILFTFWVWQVIRHYFSNFPLDLDSLVTKISSVFSAIQFSKNTLLLWGQYIVTLTIFCWLLFLAFGLGRKILRWLKIDFISFIEEICFCLGIGWGILAYLGLLFGILGLLKAWLFVILFSLISIPAIFELKDFILCVRNRRQDKLKFSVSKFGVVNFAFILILGISLVINFINAFFPEVFYDSLVYHLGAPSFFIQEGRITNVPFEVHSNLPSNMAMLYTFSLLLKDEILAKLIHFSFGLLTVLGIIAFCRRFFSVKIGIISAVIFYTVPMVAMNSWTAAVDVGLTFFEFLALYALIVWINPQDEFTQKGTIAPWLILSAILCGVAIGTKYTAIFCFMMLSVLIVIQIYYKRKQQIKADLKPILVFTGISILVFLPWVLKNLYFTGDPVYPYLASLSSEGAHLRKFLTAAREYFASFKDYLIHPWSLTMQGNTNASFIGPVFLVFAPLLFLFKNKDKITKILLIYLVGFWFLWSLSTKMLRFFMPGLAVFSILIVVCIFNADFNKIFKTATLSIVGFLCMVNLYWSSSILYNQDGWKVVAGNLTKESYLSRPHIGYPAPYFKVADYINKNLPSDTRVLLIGECRGYYVERKFLASSVYDKNPVVEWVKDSPDAESILLRMQKENITHILFNGPEANRLDKGYKIFYWNEKQFGIFKEFWEKYLRQIYTHNGVYLYEIAIK